jgi:hypothetical protein
MTRMGVTGLEFGAPDVGSPYIRRAIEEVKIIRCLPEGVVHRAVIDSVSCKGVRNVDDVEVSWMGTVPRQNGKFLCHFGDR